MDVGPPLRGSSVQTRSSDSTLQASASDPKGSGGELLLRIAGSVARLGGWSYTLGDTCVEWSDTVCDIHEVPRGYSPDINEAIGFYAPGDQEVISAAVNECAGAGRCFDVEAKIVTRAGRERWVRAIGEPIRDAEENVIGLQGAFQDITDRKLREQELIEKERLLQLAGRLAGTGAWSYDPATQALTWSDAIYERLFCPVSALDTLPDFLKRCTTGSRLELTAALERCQKTLANLDVEVQITTNRQELKSIRLSAAFHPSSHRIVGAFHDVTAQKRADAAVREHATQLQHTLESITDAFFTLNSNWRFTYVNAEAERILERRRQDLLGRSIWDEFKEAVGSEFYQQYMRCAREGVTAAFETFYAPLKRWFDVRAYPSAQGLAVYFRDATDSHTASEALRQSEERFRLVAKATSDAVRDWHLESNALWWNEGYENLFGYRRTATPSPLESWTDYIHPDDLPRVMKGIQAVLDSGGESWSDEYQFRRADGRYVYVADRGHVQRDQKGRPTRMVGGMTDLTERRAAENALRSLASRLENVLNSSLDVICTFDALGRFTQVSASCQTVLGYSAEELLRHRYIDFVVPEDRAASETLHAEMLAGVATTRFENRFQQPDGTIVYIQWSARWSAADQTMYCVARDISEAKRNAERLAEQAALLDQTHDAVMVRDLQNRFVFWSQGAKRVYGWTPAEAVNLDASELFMPSQLEFAAAMRELWQRGEWTGELEAQNKTGVRLTIDCRWTLLRTATGEAKSVLAIETDITDKKQLEAQFLRAQRMESVGTLAGGIAHDLNNVLSPILMSTGLLRMTDTDPNRLQLLSTIESSAKRGAALVRQVLTFARGAENRAKPIRPGEMLREIQTIIVDTFPRNIVFEQEIPAGLWMVNADPTQLHQVLMNLCVNARDAMPNGGRLTMLLRNVEIDRHTADAIPGATEGRFVAIEVRDTGTGIPADVMERMFEPFFTTKGVGCGTGLGLATVLTIVKSHRGFLQVQSMPGRGSAFFVYLPAIVENAPAPNQSVGPEELPRGHGETVLLVDDEEMIRNVAATVLKRFGYRVLTASDGAEALRVFDLHADEIAVVFTDVAMPVMDGGTLNAAVRERSQTVRVIGASGLQSRSASSKATPADFAAFLTKPYRAQDLLFALERVLRGGS
jgi:PAS domain S-box-containing protein